MPSSPAAKIQKWRSTIRHGYLTKINNTDTTSIAQATKLIQQLRSSTTSNTTIEVSTIHRHAMNPVFGVPQLQHDQLNVVAQHLQHIKNDVNHQRATNDSDDITPNISKLT